MPRIRRLLFLILFPTLSNGLASVRPSGGGGFGAPKTVANYLSDPTTVPLIQYLEKNKADVSKVAIGIDPDTQRRGLYTAKTFGKKGQLMCKIPSDCALALSDPAKKGLDAPTVVHGGVSLIQMYLKNPQQRQVFAPYLDCLPKEIEATPDFYSDEEIDLLEFPRIVEKAKERKQLISELSAGLEAGDDLAYATWLVSSRAFPLSIAEDDVAFRYDDRGQILSKAERHWIRVMVPLLDMANHQSEPNAKLTLIDPEKDEAWFALETLRPIPAGKEITIAYGSGADSSVELLANYGFVPESNPLDTYMLRKGGDDCLTSLADWTTTIDEDKSVLEMASDEPNLQKILKFRIKLKEAYD